MITVKKIPLTNEAEEQLVSYFALAAGSALDADYVYGKARGAALMFAGNPYVVQIKELLLKLYRERGYAFILGAGEYDNYNVACNYLNSVILSSANKYGQIIQSLTASLINDILTNYDKIRTETETFLSETTEDDAATDQDSRSAAHLTEDAAATDSSLRKNNNTPQAGNNPNLLTDTYLSSSERNTTDIGARVSNTDIDDVVTRTIGARAKQHTKEGSAVDNYTLVTRIANMDSIAKAWTTIQDAYANWLEFIDGKTLVV